MDFNRLTGFSDLLDRAVAITEMEMGALSSTVHRIFADDVS